MKRIFGSPQIANLIALVALAVSLVSALYAFRSYMFSKNVVNYEAGTLLTRLNYFFSFGNPLQDLRNNRR